MRILECGMHEIKKKCSNCGCTFAIDKSEIAVDTTGRFYGSDGNPWRFVVCPQCRHAISITIKTGIEYFFELPEGYIFKDENRNVINATKIVLEKKKKEYPKTYEECAKVLLDRASVRNDFGYKGELLVALQKLLVCRDAYWKIAGEEMGLNSWKPDWLDDDVTKYIISHDGRTFGTRGGLNYINYILAFPTEEMRDAFYENFKELIEQCKELL